MGFAMIELRPRVLALLALLSTACSEPAPPPPATPRLTLKVPSQGYKGLSYTGPLRPEDDRPFCGNPLLP